MRRAAAWYEPVIQRVTTGKLYRFIVRARLRETIVAAHAGAVVGPGTVFERPSAATAHVRSWDGPTVLLPRQCLKLARGANDKGHTISQTVQTAVSVLGIDIGKNSFRVGLP